MRPLVPLALALSVASAPISSGCGRHNGAFVMGAGLAMTFVVAPVAADAAREPAPKDPSAIHIDLEAGLVGGAIGLTGLLLAVSGGVAWLRATSDTDTDAAPRRTAAVVPAPPVNPLARTLERAVIRARAGNCAAALRLTDAIYEQDEFFYQANVPREPALAACLAARD